MSILPQERLTAPSTGKRRAFSLVEILAAVAIIAVLFVLGSAAVGKMTAKARTAKCLTQMRQAGAAFLAYAGEHDGALPTQKSEGAWYRDEASWSGKLFPYLGQFEVLACPEYTRVPPANPNAPYPPKVTYFYNPYASTSLTPSVESVRIARSRSPSQDILLIDNRSNPLGQAISPGLASPTVDPKSMPWIYPHPGSSPDKPLRSVLFLDGHVEMRTNDISYVYWQWPLN